MRTERQRPPLLIVFLQQLRPAQWSKNLLLFAALLFTIDSVSLSLRNVAAAGLGFILFCFVSGFVYILNDYFDREADRLHPSKKHRPMASGALKPSIAFGLGVPLLVGSLAAAYGINPLFCGILIFYIVYNLAYSYVFKHIVIIDIMCIAGGFVLRAVAGGVIIDVPFTPWFLLCIMLLSLFLAIGKRRQEFISLEEGKASHRKVLSHYSIGLLDQLIGIVTTATIITYSLFTFTSGHTVHLMWTIPLVVYGMFRYLYLIHMHRAGGAPERVLLEDRHIGVTVVLYVTAIVGILSLAP